MSCVILDTSRHRETSRLGKQSSLSQSMSYVLDIMFVGKKYFKNEFLVQ